jgi:hypothetical protein
MADHYLQLYREALARSGSRIALQATAAQNG